VILTFKQFFNEQKCWNGYKKQGKKRKGGKIVNNCVKEDTDTDRPSFAVVEEMLIDGIGNVTAKIDSGNEAYNVIHGVNVKIDGNNVTFNTVHNKTISAPLMDTVTIHIGSGVKEERPIVKLNIMLKGVSYTDIPFSIADRTENDEPVLVGEPFLADINAIIDVNLTSG